MNTNSTRILTVGMMKKSVATISPRWFCRKVFQLCDGGPFDSPQDARNGALGNLDSELEQLAVNARRTPQRIRPSHGLDQIADRFANRLPSHLPSRLAGQLCPIPAETLPWPANDRIWVHLNQGSSPALPKSCQHDPEHAVRTPSARALAVPLVDSQLLAECEVL